MNVRGFALRKLAYAGARYGPRPLVEYSPGFFGAFFAGVLPEERRLIRENLRALHGRRSRWIEGRDVLSTFVTYAHCLAESLGAERPEAVAAAPIVVGREHIEEALARKKGLVLVTAHTGAWDVAARWLGRDHSIDVVVVMAAEPDRDARALHDDVRARGGVRVLHVGGHAADAIPLLGHLRRGGAVAIQLDRPGAGSEGVSVPLGGVALEVPVGPFRLASLTGAPVVPVFARRLGYFRYEILVRPGISVPPRASRTELAAAAREASLEMETFLKENATQWFHFAR